MAGREQAHDRFERRGRPHRVAHVALDRVDRDLVRPPPEHPLEHGGLDAVVERGRGPVGADEVDRRGRHARLGERGPHAVLEPAAVRVGRGDVRPVAAARVAEEAPEPRPVRGVALAREEHEASALTEEGPAAPPVERPDPVARQGAEDVKPLHDEAAEDVVAAGDDDVGHPLADELGADAERGGAGGAGGRHREDGSARAEPAREVPRRAVVEGARQGPQAGRAREGALALCDAAERGADDDGEACRVPRQQRAAARPQLARGREQQPGRPALGGAPGRRRELLDFAAEPDAEVCDRKALDPRDAGATGQERRPERVKVLADRRHDARGNDRDRVTHRTGSRPRRGRATRSGAGATGGGPAPRGRAPAPRQARRPYGGGRSGAATPSSEPRRVIHAKRPDAAGTGVVDPGRPEAPRPPLERDDAR